MDTLLQFMASLLIPPFIGLAAVIAYWVIMQFFCGVVSFVINLILWVTDLKKGRV